MNYVKQFKICGVDTKQVACIELHGKPNAATEGALGVLGIDIDSPLHEVYKCVAVNGSIYTWELLSSGMSILTSSVSGGESKSVNFPYTSMRIPSGYVVKAGDLIIDKESYLYQVTGIGTSSCDAEYVGTQLCIKYIESLPQYSEGLKFTSNGDGTCYVTRGNCTDTNIVIPRKSPEGDLVTRIGSSAFTGYTSIRSVYIPDSVMTIDYDAFYGCTSLTSVTISNGVTRINERAFERTGITSLILPDSVRTIEPRAFDTCENLTSVTIPPGVPVDGFSGCTNLKRVVLLDGVTTIGEWAFGWCSNLESVTIPRSVTSIGEVAFNINYSPKLTIYAEALEKPETWNVQWNIGCPVVWGAALDIPAINDRLSNGGGGTGGEDTVAREMAQQALNEADRAFKNSDTALETADIAYNLALNAGGVELTWSDPYGTYYYINESNTADYVVFDIGSIPNDRPTYVQLGNTGEYAGSYVLLGFEAIADKPFEIKPIGTDRYYGSCDGVELWWEYSFAGNYYTERYDDDSLTYVNHTNVLVLKLTGGNWGEYYHMRFAR